MNFKAPGEIAKNACNVAIAKANWTIGQMLIMGFLGGAYIALAGFLATVVSQDAAKYVGVGLARFYTGAVFSMGLMLVVIGGGELFTGNCLMPMGVMSGCVTPYGMFRNWFWVYFANLIGSLTVAFLVHVSGLDVGMVGANALKIAANKASLPWGQSFFRGILCNWLVVMAVWMSMSAQDVVGKIFAIFFPIMGFVASGYEHSIANMYFIALGILAKGDSSVVALSELSPEKLSYLSLSGYLNNLVPVTLGNIVGGVLFVAVFYFLVFKDKLVMTGNE